MQQLCSSRIFLAAILLAAMPLAASAQEEDAKPQIDNGAKKLIQQINADVLTARYADAEAIMLKDTAFKPDLILPWIELGRAQIGLTKYTEAEASFKTALAIDPKAPRPQRDIGYYQKETPQTPHIARPVTAIPVTVPDQARTPEINGVLYSSLGEVYIRTNRIPEAEAAFDTAAQANPTQADFYLRNEIIFFFQTGNTDAQLKAAEKAIAIDASGAVPYYFKGLALATKATVDPAGKTVLPPGCTDAYQKYIELDPHGQFSDDARSFLTAAGGTPPTKAGNI